jgi:hypothetical protein
MSRKKLATYNTRIAASQAQDDSRRLSDDDAFAVS